MIASLTQFINRPKLRRLIDAYAAWAIIALAAILRLWNLGYPSKLVFDETYYVKDAWTLWNTGAEKAWSGDSNLAFETGAVNSFLSQPSFVVHPPLGKWIIGFGMWLFGAENSYSWRISVALLGIAAVALSMVIARILFRNKSWALVVGFLFAIDGHAIVLSRTALLDNILMFFALLAFYFLLRDQAVRDLSVITWNRKWLIYCGLALGAAMSVKWSGLYFAAAFGGYVVISEAIARRAAAQPEWLKNSATQASRVFFLMAPVAALTYLVSWLGWIVTPNGYDRNSESNWFTSLIRYHQDAYAFHIGLRTPHSYASHPLSWLWELRPTSFFYESQTLGENGCASASGCSSAVTALGNPFIWWPAATALFFVLVWYWRTREREAGLILLGIVGGYLPWLLYMNRTVFQFYSIAFLPWMILALVFAIRNFISRANRPETARGWLLLYLALAFLATLFFLPIWNGTWVPYDYWRVHMWLPSWI